jgi:GNAT superfamily N-acetyltransferase
MLSDLVVRPFQSADAAPVSALIATTMRQSNARDYPPDRLEALIAYFTPDKLRALAGERDCVVAVADGAVIGTAAREGSVLATFFVHPVWQRHGVGTRLLEQLERSAQALGIRSLRVEASTTGTPFYERRGYRRSGAVLAGTAGPQIELTKQISKPLDDER